MYALNRLFQPNTLLSIQGNDLQTPQANLLNEFTGLSELATIQCKGIADTECNDSSCWH
jgi:hypothetical protein